MERKIFIVLIALTLALSACGAKSELGKQQAKWDSQGVTHYRFKLDISCFCAFRSLTPVSVEVQDGKVISMLDVNGDELNPDFRSTFEEAGTIEGLFALTADALANADHVNVTYDATRGFPTSVEVDWIELAADDEMYYYITEFEVLQ